MPEQFSVDQRNKVSQILNIFGIIGQGSMLVFTMVVLTSAKDRIVADPSVIPLDFLIIVFVFAILLIVAYFIGTRLMPTEPFHEIDIKYTQHLKIIFNDKNYILTTIMQGIASFGWIIVGQVMLVYIEVVLNFGMLEYLIAALSLMFGIILFLSSWRRRIDKKGKKSTLLTVFLFAMTFLLLTLVGMIPLSPPINIIFGLIFILGIAAFTGGWYMFPPILNANLAEDGSKRSKVLLAGTYKGFPSIPLNIFQAFGSMLLGAILALPPIGTLTYSIGLIIWGPICSVFLLVAYIYTRKLLKFDFDWEKE
jgi:Na+/melibiose symporter-like transporter